MSKVSLQPQPLSTFSLAIKWATKPRGRGPGPAPAAAHPFAYNSSPLPINDGNHSLRFRTNNVKIHNNERDDNKITIIKIHDNKGDENKIPNSGKEDVKESQKKWNLRTNRVACKKYTDWETHQPVKKTKMPIRSFSISLTKEEIEKDILAMSGGAKLARRPKIKRPKHVQKALDSVFPGLGLSSITTNSYQVRHRQQD